MTEALAVAPAFAASTLVVASAYAVLWLDRFRLEGLPGMLLCAAAGVASAWMWLWWLDPALVHLLAGAEGYRALSLLTGWLVVAIVMFLQLLVIAAVSSGGRFGGLGDGVLHGIAAGAGFAGVVNVRIALETSPATAARALMQPLAVAAFCGAVLGFGIGRMKLQGRWRARLGTLALTMAIASAAGIAIHAVYPPALLEHTRSESLLGWFEPLAWAASLGGLLWVAWFEDRRIIAAELGKEAALGVLTEEIAFSARQAHLVGGPGRTEGDQPPAHHARLPTRRRASALRRESAHLRPRDREAARPRTPAPQPVLAGG
jgi:hypothetical protein